MSSIFSRLSKKSLDTVQNLKNKGWVFEDEYWEEHHNGNPHSDVKFKSPNMKEFARICQRDWPKVTLEYLLDREAHHAAHDWAKNVFHYTCVVTNPLADGLKNHFLKTKSAEFSSLYSTDAEFDVKVSPKIKNNKPKKVKVTIEIL